ncbi:hypothetical protein [Clostridium tyrobutyricum]|uniref:hypothetical protein n=1 Tax=Clostridium tyrobutyricum TaxID=1519 RepID=UPI001C38D10A|nr:hypothetical protein [Clostridium tyrobutyricum]MBV4439316.1 hypothetical protein [Clostridium tyrobutyricum]
MNNKQSLLYELIFSRGKINEKEIGDYLDRFNEKTGIGFSPTVFTREDLKKVLEIECSDQKQPINEQVNWKNMNLDKKASVLEKYLYGIGAKNNDLLIIDSYFFPKKVDSEYKKLIKQVLRKSKAKSIKIITHPEYNKDLFNDINKAINDINIKVIPSTEFHDRFWIVETNNKGFVLGTSLNGIGGRKICIIQYLEDKDVKEILDYLNCNIH